jgi:hypothetical protein
MEDLMQTPCDCMKGRSQGSKEVTIFERKKRNESIRNHEKCNMIAKNMEKQKGNAEKTQKPPATLTLSQAANRGK